MILRWKPFRSRISLLAIGLLFTTLTTIGAQDSSTEDFSLEDLPGFRERAVVMHIISRIVEQNKEVVWNSENTRVTFPGRPVGLKLVGENLVVAVQFTPFMRPGGRHILVAQGQIWINIPDEGISYHTTMQTIPLEFREQVYFFPLGSVQNESEARIEIQLVLEPYSRSGRRQGDSPDNAENGITS
ncbi:MAG: hypothetical protein FWH35_01100, partial [Treponema sp.]|nr:hypothetical protein [Treponema sp.]